MADCGELKKKRSYAQGVFTRKANTIDFNLDLLNKHDLLLELSALKSSYEDICNVSFDYIAVMEEEASDFDLDITDVRKRLQECRTKYQDTEVKIKTALWSRCVLDPFNNQKADLKDVFDQAAALQSSRMTLDQYELVRSAIEARMESLEEFVRYWDRHVPAKEVKTMQACLKEHKERSKVTMVALANHMRQSERTVHVNLASGDEAEGGADVGDDGRSSVVGGGTTTAAQPSGTVDSNGTSGRAHDDVVQRAGADPTTNLTTVVTGGASDSRASRPGGPETRFIETLHKGYLSPSTDKVLEPMFLLAFFSFLRCSEFTASTLLYDPSHHASLSDISVLSSDTLIYFLERSKTNQSGQPQPVCLFRLNSLLSPYEPVLDYINSRLACRASP
ncbi:hypothetical protein D5F01_LYC05718 [Larimichthys crocea]|uniref:Uncharacterized protein n=1 Tax=Larimichthys crocea TaxID=215358 RepID=A0A6G0IU47_LARCR|nr:hypothetical protein D5F01_LYC05718 [Larimichthys crocea]